MLVLSQNQGFTQWDGERSGNVCKIGGIGRDECLALVELPVTI